MKKTMFKKAIFLMGAVLFLISFAGMSVASEDVVVVETQTIKGSILAIHADTAMVELKNESGETMSLKAGPNINLETFIEGQAVIIECNNEGIITSITTVETVN
jgi:hypothetical protein